MDLATWYPGSTHCRVIDMIGRLHSDDVAFKFNDPYAQPVATHAPTPICVKAAFWEGEIVAWTGGPHP